MTRTNLSHVALLLLLVAIAAMSILSLVTDNGQLNISVTHTRDIERGSIDVAGADVSYVGNLGEHPSLSFSKYNILLLHGAKYSSQDWVDLGTIALLVKAGYRVAAVDLPILDEDASRDELLETICIQLGMDEETPAVIVSPSMSGSFSIPLLLRKASLFRGYVPIAPGNALSFTAEDFSAVLDVPTLAVYGQYDKMGKKASRLLASIPSSRVVEIPKAGHPAYLEDPDTFHVKLLEFLEEAVFNGMPQY